jgi:hypothetical protein
MHAFNSALGAVLASTAGVGRQTMARKLHAALFTLL